MLKVGITGGIGSGKTTVCRIFETLGISVYYADEQAKYLMNQDIILKKQIIKNFGEESYLLGELNRTYLAKIVFNNDEKLHLLNNLVHPRVQRDVENWMSAHQSEKYVLKEAALLIESKSYLHLDKMIVVHAAEKIRLERVMQRDTATAEEVKKRMSKQMDADEKLKFADYIINNDAEHSLIHQVMDIHQQLLKLSEQ